MMWRKSAGALPSEDACICWCACEDRAHYKWFRVSFESVFGFRCHQRGLNFTQDDAGYLRWANRAWSILVRPFTGAWGVSIWSYGVALAQASTLWPKHRSRSWKSTCKRDGTCSYRLRSLASFGGLSKVVERVFHGRTGLFRPCKAHTALPSSREECPGDVAALWSLGQVNLAEFSSNSS